MPIIDCQVHAYEKDSPERPWHSTLAGPPHVTGDEMVAAMDAVGVDGAILVSAFTLYQYDASYALAVRAKHPGRFALVKPANPADPAIDDVVAEWAATDGAVGIRLLMTHGPELQPDDPGVNRTLQAAARHDLPVNLLSWQRLDDAMTLADRHPETRFVLDHLGLKQPFAPPAPPAPFADLPKVLKLAERPNMAIKISGACTLSHAGYPYPDIWDPLARIFDAWGIERCLWGTDWTRATALLTYKQGVEPFRLTDRLTEDERATLMGGACARVYGWRPAK